MLSKNTVNEYMDERMEKSIPRCHQTEIKPQVSGIISAVANQGPLSNTSSEVKNQESQFTEESVVSLLILCVCALVNEPASSRHD